MGDVRFTGNWNSVNAHTVPKWYEDCKFGILIHWGIYSVPAFGTVSRYRPRQQRPPGAGGQ